MELFTIICECFASAVSSLNLKILIKVMYLVVEFILILNHLKATSDENNNQRFAIVPRK